MRNYFLKNILPNKNLIRKVSAICLLLWFLDSAWYISTLPEVTEGTPILIEDSVNVNKCKFLQVVDDSERIYILISNPTECVLVYDMDGSYQHAIYFDRSQKGILQLAATPDHLYVADAHRNIYCFINGQFQQFIPTEESSMLRSLHPFGETHDCYEIRFGSLWRIDEQGEKCLIQRNLMAVIEQYHVYYFGIIIFTLIIVFLQNRRKA